MFMRAISVNKNPAFLRFELLSICLFTASIAVACAEDDGTMGYNSPLEEDTDQYNNNKLGVGDDSDEPKKDTGEPPDKTCGDTTCEETQYCDNSLEPPECKEYPTGQGLECSSQEDCAGYDANFCEMYVSFTCLVQGCDVALDNCSDDYMCCGFMDPTTFSEDWILPETLCLARSLTGGQCQTR